MAGGAFLVEESAPESIFTAEDLSEEHLAIGRTAEEFSVKRSSRSWKRCSTRSRASASACCANRPSWASRQFRFRRNSAAWSWIWPPRWSPRSDSGRRIFLLGWHGAHCGIGTLPLLYFGTEEQKQKYLPRLASAEMIAAYALTEPQAGSDALAARTRADLTSDGNHYILNGQKMWITNGGAADLFTVFAKVGGEKFTAFLVERAFGGVTSGAEEKKMGIKGSSTTAVYFENVPVPVANVLGEIGRGHIIAFNILNIGRLKLGTLAVGGAKRVLELSIKYAKERKAFGSTIAEFGAIQHKLAEMAMRIYRGGIDGLANGRAAFRALPEPTLKSIEEYAVECSIVKVYGSEVLDYVADEGVQIHGGYGYHQDYEVEKCVSRFANQPHFEGTNEINRLLIPGMLLKRAARGQTQLDRSAPPKPAEDEEARLSQNAKHIALLMLGLAHGKYQMALEKQQEILMNLADIIMEVFAMESSWLRARKTGLAAEMCAVFLRDAMARIEQSARNVLGACAAGDELRNHMSALRRLAAYDPLDTVALRRKVAERLLARGRY